MKRKSNLFILIIGVFILSSCEEKIDKEDEKKNIENCNIDVLGHSPKLPYFMEHRLDSAMIRYFRYPIDSVINKQVSDVYKPKEVLFTKIYKVDKLFYFNSKLRIDCGDIIVCGVYDGETIYERNFGNITYVDYLFSARRNEKDYISGEMRIENKTYRFQFSFERNLKEWKFTFQDSSYDNYMSWNNKGIFE